MTNLDMYMVRIQFTYKTGCDMSHPTLCIVVIQVPMWRKKKLAHIGLYLDYIPKGTHFRFLPPLFLTFTSDKKISLT
jgi:hypothetical protein